MWTTAALVAAVAVLAAVALPPRQLILPEQDDGTVAGVVHVHTDRSDGRSPPDTVARAASRAGLQFVIFTDHGDATRAPDPPVYASGVLCLDGVEISTSEGHYLAIGMPQAPYPLGGDPAGVVEDVARLGGFGVVAHPDSPKHELQWQRWSVPFDGVEVINLDTSWRLHALNGSAVPGLKLVAALAGYPVRAVETIAGVARSTPEIMNRWQALAASRRVVAIAGTDAHARVALVDVDPGQNRLTLPFPGYEPAFRALSVRVKPARRFSGNAAADAAALLDGLRAGHAYVAVDGLATPPSFSFTARNGSGAAEQGDELDDNGPVTLSVRSNAPEGFRTFLFRNNQLLGEPSDERGFSITAPEGPAVYRVEIRPFTVEGAPTWVLSNPIYVRAATAAGVRTDRPASPAQVRVLFDGTDARVWRVESGQAASGQVAVTSSRELELRYTTSSARGRGPIALLAAVSGSVAGSDRVAFTIRADRPMRVSVQLRTHVPGVPEERWQRSVYVDGTPRTYTVHFHELAPVGPPRAGGPRLADIPDVMFVIEPEQAPGDGRLWLANVALQR
jgi:hypothetical protein